MRHEASRNFEMAKHGGNWMITSALALALVWIAGLSAVVFGLGGLKIAQTMPPVLVAGAAVIAVMPALILMMAGFMARANRRAAAANALVLAAAARLMAPAREAGTEGITYAEQMKQAAEEIDSAMTHALSAMKAMSSAIGDERLRLESVTYASADNARDLGARLAAERQALESLARDLRTQLNAMNDAIPRQAQLMVSVAREASDEFGRADHALEGRLIAMQQAGAQLSEKLGQLDSIAYDAASRTEALSHSVSRVEEKLDRSRRTVDEAVRASELAAAAAETTGDSLKSAVAVAIEGARQASAEISAASRMASEDAVRALARLREAGEQAASALRAAGLSPPAERTAYTVPGEQRLSPPRAPQIPSPAPQANGHGRPALANGRGAPRLSMDDELFDSGAEAHTAPSLPAPVDVPLELGRDTDPNDRAPLMLRKRFDDAPAPVQAETPRRRAGDALPGPANAAEDGGTGWREIIAGMGREEKSVPNDREAIAEAIVERLSASGILLGEIFAPGAKRRLAAAAAKGGKARRSETVAIAGKEIDRVSQRLRGDKSFMELARTFIDLEAADATVALDQTQKTSRNATPRLAAFLLIDAAL